MENEVPNRGGENWAILYSLVLLILVMTPIVQNFRQDPHDGFPLSYFPMFTKQRKATTKLVHPIGVKSDGTQIDLNYRLVSNGGMNQARRQLGKLVDNDKAALICDRIATKTLESDDRSLADVVRVQIVKDTIDIARFFEGTRQPKRRKILAESIIDRKSH